MEEPSTQLVPTGETLPKPRPKRRGALSDGFSHPSRPRRKTIRPKDIAEVEKMRRALDMRKSGATYDQIAVDLGYANASGAAKLVKRALELTVQESAEEVRRMESERYDEILVALHPNRGEARTAEVMIKLFERRAKLLGLDAPEKRQIEADLRSVNLGIDATTPASRSALHEFLRHRPAQAAAKPEPVDAEVVDDDG